MSNQWPILLAYVWYLDSFHGVQKLAGIDPQIYDLNENQAEGLSVEHNSNYFGADIASNRKFLANGVNLSLKCIQVQCASNYRTEVK